MGVAITLRGLSHTYRAGEGALTVLLAGIDLGLPVLVLVGAVCGSTVLALGAGAMPARRAARMPAREAMEAA